MRKFGAVLESELPWNGGSPRGSPEDYYRSAKSRRIMAYFNLGDDSVPDRTAHFAEWRKWLPQSGPVAVLIALDRHIQHRAARHVRSRFGHRQPRRRAVRLRPDHFLLRSSWGPAWGDGGYARMSLDYTAQAVIESYGVMV